jgi:uncharacterized FlaG/YvyC family protein
MSPNEGIQPISQTDLGRSDVGSQAILERVTADRTPKAAEKPAAAPVEQEKTPSAEIKASAPAKKGSDTRLRFEVDEETQRVTVLVIDRKTRKVIRAIPPDELEKFQKGDLLELLV